MAPALAPAPKIDPRAVLWDSIEDSKNPADFEAYLKQFPKGLFSDLARNRLAIANKEMLSAARNPASGAGPRLVYNIPPVQTMQGERVDVVTNIIRGTLGALPGASIVQEPVESDAYDVLVTAMISRLNRRMVPNPRQVGQTILSAIAGVAGLGTIGSIAPQGSPQLVEYDVEIVLDAWNRRTNGYVSESGLANITVDPGQVHDRQGINTALQMAANEAARRLAVRLSGGVPEPWPTARERSSAGATQGHTPQGSR